MVYSQKEQTCHGNHIKMLFETTYYLRARIFITSIRKSWRTTLMSKPHLFYIVRINVTIPLFVFVCFAVLVVSFFLIVLLLGISLFIHIRFYHVLPNVRFLHYTLYISTCLNDDALCVSDNKLFCPSAVTRKNQSATGSVF